MMYTFYDAKQDLAEYVRTGLCPNHADVAKDINDASQRLLQAEDSLYSQDIVRIWTQNNSISLPRGYVSARMVRINYIPREIRALPYEFLAFGPRNTQNNYTQLVEEGVGHPCFFDVPMDKEYGLFAVSTQQPDDTQSMTIRAIHNDGAELRSSDSPDISLPIKYWDGGSEGTLTYQPTNQLSETVAKVTQVILPSGLTGYVSFYAVDPDDGKMWFLSRYHPDETRPGYRRYRLPVFTNGSSFGSTARGTEPSDGTCVECLCKKDFIKLTRDNDLLPVQNLTALKFMVQAIYREKQGDLNTAVAYKQLALENARIQEANQSTGARFNINVQGTATAGDLNLI